ncbi:hypothetical protein [Photobacterium indicum]|uniref:hypothetical protein n=1 Tax=Photobacterium indicum TaxID=81447 RepID=UPI003D0B2E4E
MSDSDNTLLAAVAMRAKKNAIDQGDQEATAVSITAKVKALSEAGFSDGEIDKILAVDATQSATLQTDKTAATEEYNEQVDETINHAKVHTGLMIVMAIGFIVTFFLPGSLSDHAGIAIGWMVFCFAVMLLRTIPFAFKKAGYFLKR